MKDFDSGDAEPSPPYDIGLKMLGILRRDVKSLDESSPLIKGKEFGWSTFFQGRPKDPKKKSAMLAETMRQSPRSALRHNPLCAADVL
jgi:hypothetical protein